ncbi:MAG TPA: hypothetical protein VK254_04765 [Candidatus Bathyarchaeia archaeon]|nr:hypothetical protein [Candidatus Bathyarchaeia archaeon]
MGVSVKLAGSVPSRWKTESNIKFHDHRKGAEGLDEYITGKALIVGIMQGLSDIACEGDFQIRISNRGEHLSPAT